MMTIKKNPFELSALDNPTYDRKYIYLTIRVDTRKDPKVIKPGDSPGGLYLIKYKERIEKKEPNNPDSDLLLVDGELSWFNGMGSYQIKDLGKNEEFYKDRRLSYIDFNSTEVEIYKQLRSYLVDVFTVMHT